MSRSRKKTPAGGATTIESEKADKAAAHRVTRRVAKELLRAGEEVLPDRKQTENPWDYGKDGKLYYGRDCDPSLTRK